MEAGRDRDALLEELRRRAAAAAQEVDRERERAGTAAAAAGEVVRRSRLLTTFSRHFRRNPNELPLRCAWCDRVVVGDEFVAPEEFLEGDLPRRLRERATHGICPECLERENRTAAEKRARRR